MSPTPSSHFRRKFADVDEGLNWCMDYYADLQAEARPGNPLMIYESPPKLGHLATLKVAAQLMTFELRTQWKDFRPGLLGVLDVREWTRTLTGCWKVLDELQFSDEIRLSVAVQMDAIAFEFFTWMRKHLHIIDDIAQRFADELLPEFVWKWGGSVDYLQTGYKLIIGTKLNDREKFKMMCAYCLVCDIKELYKSHEWVKSCEADAELMANEHVFYWDCYLNYVKPLPPDDFEGSYAKFMLSRAFNPIAAGYYFTVCCTVEEQHDFCAKQMMRLGSFQVKFLLMAMSEEEQSRLFESHVLLFIDLFLRENCFHFALQLWNHVKDSMTDDQFIEMMRTHVLKTRKMDQRVKFALHVWDGTPRRLKELFFRYQNGSLIFEWREWSFCLEDDRLLSAILSDADTEFRIRFWMCKWPLLTVGSQPALLRKFMIICLGDVHEIRKFAPLILHSDSMDAYLRGLFATFNFYPLQLFIDILAPDPIQRKQWKIRMINRTSFSFLTHILQYRRISDEKWNYLTEFLREVDAEDKNKFVSSWVDEWYARKYLSEFSDPRVIYDNMINIVARLCDDQLQRQIFNEKISSYDEFACKVVIDWAERDYSPSDSYVESD